MQIARVVGNVVSTSKSDKIKGLKLLLVKPIDLETFEEKGSVVVAFDTVGAGEGEVVMIVSGRADGKSSLRYRHHCHHRLYRSGRQTYLQQRTRQ